MWSGACPAGGALVATVGSEGQPQAALVAIQYTAREHQAALPPVEVTDSPPETPGGGASSRGDILSSRVTRQLFM